MKTILYFLLLFTSLLIICEVAIRFTSWDKGGDLVIILIYDGIISGILTYAAMSTEENSKS